MKSYLAKVAMYIIDVGSGKTFLHLEVHMYIKILNTSIASGSFLVSLSFPPSPLLVPHGITLNTLWPGSCVYTVREAVVEQWLGSGP